MIWMAKKLVEILSQIFLPKSFFLCLFIGLWLYGDPGPRNSNFHKRFLSTFPEYECFTRSRIFSALLFPLLRKTLGSGGGAPGEFF